MTDYFRDKCDSLPRPERWMPGPPAPWSLISPTERRLSISQIQDYLIRDREKAIAVNAIADNELPDVAIENTGDEFVSAPSAVLVPFITHGAGDNIDSVIVMTRSMSVSRHKGQVSFPGGMIDSTDVDATGAALRETYEEIGVTPEAFTILGTRPDVHTRSRASRVTPVIATCPPSVVDDFSINPPEVDTLHVIPLESVLAPDAYMSEIWDFPQMSATIHMYFVYDVNDVPVFIWGATAHILTDILHCLKPTSVQ